MPDIREVRPRYYKLAGTVPIPSTEQEWSICFCSRQPVGRDTIKGFLISTVWLGLDHAVSGPPLLWETMIFGSQDDEYCERYSTYEDALAGHQRIVRIIESNALTGEIPHRLLSLPDHLQSIEMAPNPNKEDSHE